MKVGDKVRYLGNDAQKNYYGRIETVHANGNFTVELTHDNECNELDFPSKIFNRQPNLFEKGHC